MKPLQGIRVLDLGSFITAPHAAMLLAEMGADVVKVERPGTGDPFRWYLDGLSSPIFQAHNRNKRSIALDYVRPQGREVLDALVKGADVVVLNMRPGVERRLGLDPRRLHIVNPRLVYCSITGFGPDGPYAARPAYDTVGLAMSGYLGRVHDSDDPRVPGPSVSDTVTGITMAMGALAALVERNATGTGRVVETSMIEATIGLAVDPVHHLLVTGSEQPYFQRGAASQAYVLACRDGKRVSLHLSSPDKFWAQLAAAVERPDFVERYPDRATRAERYGEIARELAAIFATRDRLEWMARLEANDVPFAPVLSIPEVIDDPQVRHLGVVNEITHPLVGVRRGVNRAVRFDGDNRSAFRPVPRLGEHTDEILRELGLPADRVAELRAAKVVQDDTNP